MTRLLSSRTAVAAAALLALGAAAATAAWWYWPRPTPPPPHAEEGAPPSTPPPAADPARDAVVELLLPPESRVLLDDQDQGPVSQLTVHDLPPDRLSRRRLGVQFRSGAREDYTLLLQGGQRLRLARLSPDAPRPELVLPTGHSSMVSAVALSPDGRWVASVGWDGEVVVWDAETGRQLRTLGPPGFAMTATLEISVDGRRLLSAASGRPILYDLASGRIVREFHGPVKDVHAAVFSPDGLTVAGGGAGHAIVIWDVGEEKEPRMLKERTGEDVNSLAFSSDGRRLLSVDDKAAVLWDVPSGRVIHTFEGEWLSAGLSPDGRIVATCSRRDSVVHLLDAETGNKLKDLTDDSVHFDGCESVCFGPEGTTVLTGGLFAAFLWDCKSGKVLATYPAQTAGSGVTAAAFGAKGSRVATGLQDGSVVLWDTQSGQTVRRLEGWLAPTTRAAFAADGRPLLGADLALLRLDPGSPHATAVLAGDRGSLYTAVFSPDGSLVLTVGSDRTAVLWDAATGRKVRTFTGNSAEVFAAAFSADGRRILTGSNDGSATLWDADTGALLHRLEGHEKPITGVALSPDGRFALTASEDCTAILWNTSTGLQARAFETDNIELYRIRRDIPDYKPLPLTSAGFSPDGKTVVTTDGMDASLWDTATGRRRRTLKPDFLAGDDLAAGGAETAAFSPDGRRVATASLGRAFLWNPDSGRIVRSFQIEPHDPARSATEEEIRGLAFSADGSVLEAGTTSGLAVLWDVATGKQRRTFNEAAPGTPLHDLLFVEGVPTAFSPDGRMVLTLTPRGPALWDAAGGGEPRLLRGVTASDVPPSFSADGKVAATAGNDNTVDIWDLEKGSLLRSLAKHPDKVSCCAFSPDRRLVVTGCGDGVARVWALEDGRLRRELPGLRGALQAVAFGPDGRRVAAAFQDGVALWDVETGERQATLDGPASSLAFAPDGRLLAGSLDGAPVLWGEKGERLRTLEGGPKGVTAVAVSPDGRLALSAAPRGKAVLWDLEDGSILRSLEADPDWVHDVAFSPDGRLILTAGMHGARLWETATGLELLRLIRLRDSDEWMAVSPEGLFDGGKRGRELLGFRADPAGGVSALDRFFSDYYYPGLLDEVLRGARPLPGKASAAGKAPLLRLLLNPDGPPDDPGEAVLDVAVTDAGDGVRGPWLLHNGVRLALPSEPVRRQGPTVVSRFHVPLAPGENRLEARAATADGGREGEPAALTLSRRGAADPPRLFVLAVGIGHYASVADLAFAADDARAVAALLKEQAARPFAEVRVRTLLNDQATGPEILHAVGELKEARPQDVLVVYVSCHGRTVGQRYYLIPYNFRLQTPERPDDDVQQQGLSIDDLGEALAAVPALKRVLIFDTCYSGSVAGLAGKSQNPLAYRGAIERFGRAVQGVYSLSAATANEDAGEHPALRHGLLTYALLAACGRAGGGPLADRPLPAPPAGRDGDVLEWFAYARTHVPELYARYARYAHSVEVGGEDQPGFALLRLGGR